MSGDKADISKDNAVETNKSEGVTESDNRRRTRSSTRGVQPAAPPPAKREKRTPQSGSKAGSRRGRPKKDADIEDKPVETPTEANNKTAETTATPDAKTEGGDKAKEPVESSESAEPAAAKAEAATTNDTVAVEEKPVSVAPVGNDVKKVNDVTTEASSKTEAEANAVSLGAKDSGDKTAATAE